MGIGSELPSGPRRSTTWALIALALVPYFVGLDAPSLFDANEPLYAQPPKEVVEEGGFFAPTCNGRVYYPHPPLATWLTVPAYLVFGPSELGHRVPMAILSAITILATYAFGRRLGGPRTGLFAALVLAGTPRVWMFARQLGGDVALTAFLMVAFVLALPTLEGERAPRRWYGAKVIVGIACLAKGPVAIVLYGGTVLLTWLFARPRVPFRTLAPVSSTLVVLAFGAPWFVWMSLTFDDFAAEFFGRYNVARAAGELGSRGPFFYFIALLGDAQPWILLVPFGIHRAIRLRSRGPTQLLPWIGIAFTVLLFSLSAGKRNVYLLPIYPLLAIGVAPVLVDAWLGFRPKLVQVGGLALGVLGLVGAGLVIALQHHAPDLAPEVFVLVGLFVAASLFAVYAVIRRKSRAIVGMLLLVPLLLEFATAVTFPALDRYRPVPELAAVIRDAETPDQPERVVVYRSKIQSLRFYLGRHTRVAATPDQLRGHLHEQDGAFVLTWGKRVDELLTELPELRFEELARAPFLIFNFRRSILGDGETTRDLVVLRVTGRADPRPELPRGGCE